LVALLAEFSLGVECPGVAPAVGLPRSSELAADKRALGGLADNITGAPMPKNARMNKTIVPGESPSLLPEPSGMTNPCALIAGARYASGDDRR
jgi:hypothetical protein